MFKKILVLIPLMFGLAACGPDVYYQDAMNDAQQTYQQHYVSYDDCYHAFPFANDCQLVGGVWYSPPYYPWGAVIHYNHVVTYGHTVPMGGVLYHTNYAVHVDYSRARSYVSSRQTYYHAHTSVVHTPYVNKTTPVNSPSRSGFTSYTKPSSGTASSTFNSASRSSVSKINFNSTPSSSRSNVSRISFGSSSSSRSSYSSRSSSSSSRRGR